MSANSFIISIISPNALRCSALSGLWCRFTRFERSSTNSDDLPRNSTARERLTRYVDEEFCLWRHAHTGKSICASRLYHVPFRSFLRPVKARRLVFIRSTETLATASAIGRLMSRQVTREVGEPAGTQQFDR